MNALAAKETIHIYYEREKEKRPYALLPLVCAVLCLLGVATVTLYSANHPSYEHARMLVAARALPPQTFTASVQVVPTGIKTYPATTAHGVLTITNGSIIAQVIPIGFTISNVATDATVYVPPSSANGYGYATVQAHALTPGVQGNIAALAINAVEGSSLYIRNLAAFRGGADSYSVKCVTAQDKHTALLRAQGILLSKTSGLHYPCNEHHFGNFTNMVVTLRCQFVTFTVPSYMHVASVQLIGNRVVLPVWYIPCVQYARFK